MSQKTSFMTRNSLLPPLKRKAKDKKINVSKLDGIYLDADKYFSLNDLEKMKSKKGK